MFTTKSQNSYNQDAKSFTIVQALSQASGTSTGISASRSRLLVVQEATPAHSVKCPSAMLI